MGLHRSHWHWHRFVVRAAFQWPSAQGRSWIGHTLTARSPRGAPLSNFGAEVGARTLSPFREGCGKSVLAASCYLWDFPESVERDFPHVGATWRLRKTPSCCMGSHAGGLASRWAGCQNGAFHVRRGFCLLRKANRFGGAYAAHANICSCVNGCRGTPWRTGVESRTKECIAE